MSQFTCRDILDSTSIPAALRIRIISRVFSEAVFQVLAESRDEQVVQGQLTKVQQALLGTAKELFSMQSTAVSMSVAFNIVEHFAQSDEIKSDDERRHVIETFMGNVHSLAKEHVLDYDKRPRAKPYQQGNDHAR